MFRAAFFSIFLLIGSFLSGCGGSGGGGDALQRERDAMAEEAKATQQKQQQGAGASTPASTATTFDPNKPAHRVPAGTVVDVLLSKSLSSRSATTGAEWQGTLAKDIKTPEGRVVMAAGAEVAGRIVLASDGSGLRRKHELELRIYRIRKSEKDPWVDVLSRTSIQEGGANSPVVLQAQQALSFQLSSTAMFP
ncbi:MAG: hypothetical protein IT162_03215 [Bryobacterales bacterium]|nr:hypothetical protein [Bryobacterales bacterium]